MKKILFITALLIGFLGSAQDSIVKAVSLKGRGPFLVKGSITGTTITGAQIVDSLNLELGSTDWQGGGSSIPVDDTTSLVQDPVDNTKQVRIDAGAITTGTTRTITMPDADVDLGNLGASNLDLTDNYTFEGGVAINRGDGIPAESGFLSIGTGGIYHGVDEGVSGQRWITTMPTAGGDANKLIFRFQQSAQTSGIFGTYLTRYSLNSSGSASSSTDVINKGYADANYGDQTAAEVPITDAAGYYTGTDVEAMGQEIGSDLADRPTSLGTGRTNPVEYSDIYGQTLSDYNTDGAGSAGDLIIITDASPAEVVTTATIAMDGWKMYDDQTADAATITLSDCDPGETLTVYINRASAPTLAGTGLTFNQLPNTTAFASATEMMIIFEVAYDGTTIDYYYVER